MVYPELKGLECIYHGGVCHVRHSVRTKTVRHLREIVWAESRAKCKQNKN